MIFLEAYLRSTFNSTWRIEAQVYISLISAVFPLWEGSVSNIDFTLGLRALHSVSFPPVVSLHSVSWVMSQLK
jgi:hypothetical protein